MHESERRTKIWGRELGKGVGFSRGPNHPTVGRGWGLMFIWGETKSNAVYFLFYTSTVITYLVTCWRFAVVTVQLLEPGHLDEDGPITTVSENKRFSSFCKCTTKIQDSTMQPLNKSFECSGPLRKQLSNLWMLLVCLQKILEKLLFSEIVVIRQSSSECAGSTSSTIKGRSGLEIA